MASIWQGKISALNTLLIYEVGTTRTEPLSLLAIASILGQQWKMSFTKKRTRTHPTPHKKKKKSCLSLLQTSLMHSLDQYVYRPVSLLSNMNHRITFLAAWKAKEVNVTSDSASLWPKTPVSTDTQTCVMHFQLGKLKVHNRLANLHLLLLLLRITRSVSGNLS